MSRRPGVYLKSNAAAVAALGLPPPHLDLGLRFVETQLAAVPEDPGALGVARAGCWHCAAEKLAGSGWWPDVGEGAGGLRPFCAPICFAVAPKCAVPLQG